MDALKSFMIKNDVLFWGRRKLEKTSFFLGAVGCMILTSLLWASLFQIDKVVRVEGKVIPTGHSRPLQHLEGGIVSAISTHEGAVVKQGDLLLTIDATTAGATLNESKIKLATMRAKAARLKVEAGHETELRFPDDLAQTPVAASERNLYESRKSKLASDMRVSQETVRQHKAAYDEIDNRRKSLESELTVARQRSQMLGAMAARKAASQMELLEAQSRERRFETELADADGSKPKIKAAMAAEQARVASMAADYKSEAQGELVATLAEIDRLNEIVTAATDRVKRTEICAPIDGVINRISTTTIGAVVKPGETIVELTPSSQEILVEAHVIPQDRGELRPGIDAKVRVSAYDSATLGVLLGRLTEISADTMLDPRGDAYYRAKILIGDLPAAYASRPIIAGMTITGDLVTGRRTIMSHLLSPLRKFSHNMFRDSR